jgi:hypothetical protein
MIAQLEKGVADYLATVETLGVSPAYVARAATSSEAMLPGQGYVLVKAADIQYVPGSDSTVAMASLELRVMSPANVEGYNATREGVIEAAVVSAFAQANKTAISTLVVAACGYTWSGHFTEGFREGKDSQWWQPFLPVKASLVKA